MIVHALSKTLAERGHEVTVVSPFPLEEKIKNHREIKSLITEEAQKLMSNMVKKSDKSVMNKAVFSVMHSIVDMGIKTVQSEEFRALLDEKFDLLIIGVAGNNFLLGLGDHFKCPTAVLSVQRHVAFSNVLSGNPTESHSVPHLFLNNEEIKVENFVWRLKNFLAHKAENIFKIYMDYDQKKAYKYEKKLASIFE